MFYYWLELHNNGLINTLEEAPNESIIFNNEEECVAFYDESVEMSVIPKNINNKTLYFMVKNKECFYVKNPSMTSSIYSTSTYHNISYEAWVFGSLKDVIEYLNNPELYLCLDITNMRNVLLHTCIKK